MRGWRSLAMLGGVAVLVASPRADAQDSFQGLGALPGASPGSVAAGLSADGLVVVGGCPTGATCSEAWRWTQAGGIQGLGFLPGESTSGASATSADGAVVYGASEDSIFRWTSAGMVDIGAGLPSGPSVVPTDLSSDGLVAVGGFFDLTTLQGGAFRWTSGVGVEVLMPFTIPNVAQFAALSSDGAVIAGSSGIPDDPNPFFRTDAGGTTFLPELPLGDCQCGSQALGISSGGQTIVGTSHQKAFRWTAVTGTLDLGAFLPMGFNDVDSALDVSSAGDVIVGRSDRSGGSVAFLWTDRRGIRDLRAELVSLGLDLTGWTLTSAVAVSDDGAVIAGNGINPSGSEEAWIASVPTILTVPSLGSSGAVLLWALLGAFAAWVLRVRAISGPGAEA